jgi:hypothetical protein
LNGASQSDVGPAARSNLISGDSAKIPAVEATKKAEFFRQPDALNRIRKSSRKFAGAE